MPSLPDVVTIDPVEDDGWAVLEYGPNDTWPVPVRWLPDAATEGTVLRLIRTAGADESRVQFVIDTATETIRRTRVRRKLDRLRNRS